MTTFPPQILPSEVAQYPSDPYRIIPILEEIRKVWDKEPGKTLGQILAATLYPKYSPHDIYTIFDDEFLAALQNSSNG